jgi:hypothetical protein
MLFRAERCRQRMGPGLGVWVERMLAAPTFHAATTRRFRQLRGGVLSDASLRAAFAQLAATAPELRVRPPSAHLSLHHPQHISHCTTLSTSLTAPPSAHLSLHHPQHISHCTSCPECGVGDSQGSRRRVVRSSAPLQEMPNLECPSFAERLTQEGLPTAVWAGVHS